MRARMQKWPTSRSSPSLRLQRPLLLGSLARHIRVVLHKPSRKALPVFSSLAQCPTVLQTKNGRPPYPVAPCSHFPRRRCQLVHEVVKLLARLRVHAFCETHFRQVRGEPVVIVPVQLVQQYGQTCKHLCEGRVTGNNCVSIWPSTTIYTRCRKILLGVDVR